MSISSLAVAESAVEHSTGCQGKLGKASYNIVFVYVPMWALCDAGAW